MEITEEEFRGILEPILGEDDTTIEWISYLLDNDEDEED